MLTVIWGINRLYVVDLMTEQHSYKTQYFLTHILCHCCSQYFQTVANRVLVGSVCTLTIVASTAQRPLRNLPTKIRLFEYPIGLTAWPGIF
jgi:hypothetical protein